LNQSQRLAEMAQKGYKTGANSYLEVIEAQRTLRAVRTEYYTALADHSKAIAELEWAAAVELSKPVEVNK
jgi:outer membrane protein TolC